ncbi:MAG: DUF5067 domain-containing protein [Clostridiales bacterium]|nr:DUF5067 domain-containing protein [Clostridiales bacterium]
MKKRVLFLTLTALLAFALAGCGGEASTGDTAQQETNTPPDLTGVWTEIDASEESYQQAIISGDTITVNWVTPDSSSLYWAGTFAAPTSADEPYTWTSENDVDQTAFALLASTDETKDFTYEDGKISYEVSAFGTTTTVRLERTGDAPVATDVEEPLGVTIDTAAIITDDYTGEKALAVQFTFTNTSDETKAPSSELGFNAYQNGVQIQEAFISNDGYDLLGSSLEVQPGCSNSFWVAYSMTDENAPVEIAVVNYMSISNEKLAEKTFDPTALT